jgi:hypothetical protein
MRSHILDYTYDMPEVHLVPDKYLEVRSTIGLPSS